MKVRLGYHFVCPSYALSHSSPCRQADAQQQAEQAIEKFSEENQISKHIKVGGSARTFWSSTHPTCSPLPQMFFDSKYGPTWHCIVGSDFRAFVTHESKHFIFFYIGKTAICLYKAG